MRAVQEATLGLKVRVSTVLRTRKVGRLLGGVLLSGIGSMVHLSVTSWLMYSLTKSAAMVGLLIVVQYVPMLALTLPAGILADYKDRRTLMLTNQSVQMTLALTLAILVWTGQVRPWMLLGVTACMGVGAALGAPLWFSTIASLVEREHLMLSSSLSSIAFHMAGSIGPLAGAALLKFSGPGAAFLVNAISFIPIMLVVRTLPKGMVGSTEFRGIKESFMQTLRFARISGRARRLLPIGSAAAIVCFGLPAILPAYASAFLKGGSSTYGMLMASFGVGAFTGAVSIGVLSERVAKRNLILGGALLMGTGIATLSIARTLGAALAAGAAGGAGQIVLLVTVRTVLQLDAPRPLHGRLVSLWLVVTLGVGAIGATVLGWIADTYGVANAARSAGVYALLLALTVLIGSRTPAVDVDHTDHSLLETKAA
ncbi:MAG TPA: MFS transporter [Actinomycetota bacterium]|nr:MFS transporter [Actinomycetota bacterium]